MCYVYAVNRLPIKPQAQGIKDSEWSVSLVPGLHVILPKNVVARSWLGYCRSGTRQALQYSADEKNILKKGQKATKNHRTDELCFHPIACA